MYSLKSLFLTIPLKVVFTISALIAICALALILSGTSNKKLFNNLLIVLVSAFIQVPMALALALLISDKSRSSVIFRAIFFLPYILGEIVAGLIWRYIYDGNYGVVAVICRWFGQQAPEVLATEGWATAALLLVVVWRYFGFHMALFVAGRQGWVTMCSKRQKSTEPPAGRAP